jgi:hypothetical protein
MEALSHNYSAGDFDDPLEVCGRRRLYARARVYQVRKSGVPDRTVCLQPSIRMGGVHSWTLTSGRQSDSDAFGIEKADDRRGVPVISVTAM